MLRSARGSRSSRARTRCRNRRGLHELARRTDEGERRGGPRGAEGAGAGSRDRSRCDGRRGCDPRDRDQDVGGARAAGRRRVGGELDVPTAGRRRRGSRVVDRGRDRRWPSFAARGTLFELEADGHAHPGGKVHCIRHAKLSLDGALGYHELAWSCGDDTGKALVIAAPTRAWGSPGTFDNGGACSRRSTGSLRARAATPATSGPCGTVRAGRGARWRLRRDAADPGGVPRRPCAFSPYSPASRLFWNEMYLDLPRFGGELGVAVPDAPAPKSGLIDYRAQYAWRRPVIDRLAKAFFADRERTAAVTAWAQSRGVFDYAAFRAIGKSSARAGAGGRPRCATGRSRRGRARRRSRWLATPPASTPTCSRNGRCRISWARCRAARSRCISIFRSASAWTRTRSGAGAGCS